MPSGLAHHSQETTRVRPASRPDRWSEAGLCQSIRALQQQVAGRVGPASNGHGQRDDDGDDKARRAMVALGLRPDLQASLRQRRDPDEAIQDLVVRYAFQALMVEGRAFYELDDLSQAMIEHTLRKIHQRAAGLSAELGGNPLLADDGLLLSICKTISHHDLRQPIGAHITWKLRRCESDACRAMRQIKHLVTRPEVKAAFLDYLAGANADAALRGQLAGLAQTGRLNGLDYKAVVEFFARPATVAFVKRFAASVQTARTLYSEHEYEGLLWQGKRRLPAGRRQGYLDAALANYQRGEEKSLDASLTNRSDESDSPRYELLAEPSDADDPAWERLEALHHEPFEAWVTQRALAARPNEPLWQAAAHLYLHRLTPDEALARGLADRPTLEAVQERIEALRADAEVWQAWLETSMR